VLRVSRENTLFQHLQTLQRNRNKRHRAGEFVVEGVRAINQALAHRWTVKALVYGAGRPLSAWARGVLAGAPDATRVEMLPALLQRLSDKEETSELLAVLAIPPDSTARLPQRTLPLEGPGGPLLVAVFDRPVYPGNLGQVIRAADALGAGGLIVSGHGADVYDPLTVRASMGSLFALPVVRLPSHREVGEWVEGLRRAAPGAPGAPGAPRGPRPGRASGGAPHPEGSRVEPAQRAIPEGVQQASDPGRGGHGTGRLQIVAGSGEAQTPLEEVDLTRPTVLVFGNETRGLSAAYRDLADVLARIPMQGAADSLNVASAATILLYEASRQRRAAGRPPQRPA
jgi:TrmH family RNA methyltransferase